MLAKDKKQNGIEGDQRRVSSIKYREYRASRYDSP